MTPELFENICRSALGHRTSQESTYDLARVVLERGIPGDFVECGVFAGASAAIMAHAIMDHWEATHADGANTSTDRAQFLRETPRVHLFDSFAGIPAIGPHDDPAQVREGEARCSLPEVQANMRRWDIPDELLVYHEGLFSETIRPSMLEQYPIRQVAYLRLDGDLYESTKVCMDELYPLVSKGGYVICDDYDLHGCRYAVHQTVMPAPIAWRKWL